MKLLAVDTSATAASCCLWEDGRILGRFSCHAGLTHSRTLLPMIEALCDAAATPLSAVDLLAVSVGPGSFTGVRIGTAAIKGLALPNQTPCVGVSTLAAMARQAAGLLTDATVCAVMDARCGQVYTALFDLKDGEITRRTADEAISLSDLQQRLRTESRVVLVGDGAEVAATALSDLPQVTLAPLAWRMQDAVGVAMEAAACAARGETVSARDLLPTYLRVPQAERERLARLAAEGLV